MHLQMRHEPPQIREQRRMAQPVLLVRERAQRRHLRLQAADVPAALGALRGAEDAAEWAGLVGFLFLGRRLGGCGGIGGRGGKDVGLCEERPSVPDAPLGDAHARIERFVALGGGAAARGEGRGDYGGAGEGAFRAAPRVACAGVFEREALFAGGDLQAEGAFAEGEGVGFGGEG